MSLEGLLDQRFAAFILVFAVLIVTPGPDTAMVIRSALSGGWRASFLTAVGIGVGTIAWAIAALLGVAVILRSSELAFAVLQLAGGVYLAYLGARTILAALRHKPADADPRRDRGDAGRSFRQGLISNLLNAKSGPFFLTVLPQFVDRSDPVIRWVVMLVAYEAMLLLWLGAYGFIVTRAAHAFVGGRLGRWLEGATGVVLVALGVRLVLDRP